MKEKVQVSAKKELKNQYTFLNKNSQNSKFHDLSQVLMQIYENNGPQLPSIIPQTKTLKDNISKRLKRLQSKINQAEKNIRKADLPSAQRQYSNIMMPLTYGVPYGLPFQPQFYQPSSTPQQTISSEIKNSVKKVSKIIFKKKLKRNRFKICAIAVYFSLFLKYYSKRFTQNRKKKSEDLFGKDEKIIKNKEQKFMERMLGFDLIQMVKTANKGSKQEISLVLDWEKYTNTALVPSSSLGDPETGKYIINFIQALFGEFSSMFSQQDFLSENHGAFSAGSLDLSFLIDNLYLPQENPFLYIHPTKGYLRLDNNSEISILLLKVIVKMLIFEFLLPISEKKKHGEMKELDELEYEKVLQMTKVAAIYLHMICREVYEQRVLALTHTSNFKQVGKKFGVWNRKRLGQVDSDGWDEQNNGKLMLILGLKGASEIERKMNENSELLQYKSMIKQKVLSLLFFILSALKKQENKIYLQIKHTTLDQQFLISEGIKKQRFGHASGQAKQKKQRADLNNYKWQNVYEKTKESTFFIRLCQQSKENPYKILNSSRLASTKTIMQPSRVSATDPSKISGYLQKQQISEQVSEDRILKQSIFPNLFVSNVKQLSNYGENLTKHQFSSDVLNCKFGQDRQDRLKQKLQRMLSK